MNTSKTALSFSDWSIFIWYQVSYYLRIFMFLVRSVSLTAVSPNTKHSRDFYYAVEILNCVGKNMRVY